MKKRIFLGIGLLLILLPILSPTSTMTNAFDSPPPRPSNPELNAVTEGTKLFYNITNFEYGAGIWDVLDMLLAESGAPSFDKGLVGTLEGSYLQVYISAMRDLTLYKYNYSDYTYYDPRTIGAIQAFMFLELNDDIMAYANVSQFSFPDDFAKTDFSSYYDYWPWADFREMVNSTELWSGFNSSFTGQYTSGWYDYNNSWGYYPWSWEWPDPDWFGDGDIYSFGWELGMVVGYDIGYYSCEYSFNDPLWYDPFVALDGWYTSFFDARDDGFWTGSSDFIATKIPDREYGSTPVPANMYDYAYWNDYTRIYEMYYRQGFEYEAAQIYFNRDLINSLYEGEHRTYYSGYVEGYENYYWNGFWNGENDRLSVNPYGTNYWPPYPWDPWDARDEGYVQGMMDGYDQGYDDGFWNLNVGEQYLQGMWNYKYGSYYDGFTDGSADALASLPESPSPVLPFPPATTDPYEQGANWMYENQYNEGYHNGYLYATLVYSPNSLNWLWHAGPFYNITLPDIEFNLYSGSILPIPVPMTMFKELDPNLPGEYEFNWGAHDYYPFTEAFIPLQTFDASNTDWTDLDTLDVARNDTEGSPGFNTTWDQVNSYFEFRMEMNQTGPGIYQEVIWGYNTSTGMLLNATVQFDFYMMTDMWIDATLELDESKTQVFTPSMPSPSSWTYLVDNFIFYYDLPPTAPPEFVDGIAEFKANGRASIGNPMLGVDIEGFDGLWVNATMTMYDPANVSRPPNIGNYRWPMFSGGGPLWLTDWDFFDGVLMSATSVFGNVGYFVNALTALSGQNTNVILNNLVLNPGIDSYYYSAMDIIYFYFTIDAQLDFEFSMLNGEFVWETLTQVGWVRGTLWAAIDYTTGVLLGVGLKTSFDFEMTQVPDYGLSGGVVSAYLEGMISANFASIPDLYTLIGGLPAVPEFGLVTILSIIGLAAISSAVIFTKRRK
jgi:hypothetical protein